MPTAKATPKFRVSGPLWREYGADLGSPHTMGQDFPSHFAGGQGTK